MQSCSKGLDCGKANPGIDDQRSGRCDWGAHTKRASLYLTWECFVGSILPLRDHIPIKHFDSQVSKSPKFFRQTNERRFGPEVGPSCSKVVQPNLSSSTMTLSDRQLCSREVNFGHATWHHLFYVEAAGNPLGWRCLVEITVLIETTLWCSCMVLIKVCPDGVPIFPIRQKNQPLRGLN